MILVLNCGSQSIKWKVFEEKSLKARKEGRKDVFNSKEYEKILREELKKIKYYAEEISIIGHRIVHGGEDFKKAIRITNENLEKLERLNKFAPLHNPFNILGVKLAREFFSGIPHFVFFDTEFYNSLPKKAVLYPLPEELREKYNFKRFGFHGISHEFAAREGAKVVKKTFKRLKIITCHLGGGSSITAVKQGKAVDTSMGFTPLEGVVMMTRSGSIDPSIALVLAKDFPLEKVSEILYSESGVKGICGLSDMRDVLKKIEQGSKKAKLALELFIYSIQKCISAYFGVLGGCDLLIFTGAIGFGSRKIRNMICRDLNILRKTNVLAIAPDEELAIARKIISEI